jgi:hypothetical protein
MNDFLCVVKLNFPSSSNDELIKSKIDELRLVKQQLENMKAEREKMKDTIAALNQKNRKLRRLSLGLKKDGLFKNAEIKTLKKQAEKQRSEIEKVHFERMALNAQIEAANGALSVKVKHDLVRAALEGFLSKAQMDRVLFSKNTKWSTEDIMTSTVLFSHSSRAYRYLREEMRFPLPAASTLRAHIARMPVEAGLLKAALILMKGRASCMSALHRAACLSFDEVYHSSDYVFDSKEDKVLGGSQKTQVIMLRGLFAPWKGPVYFQHSQPVTEELLDHVITEVHNAGFQVVSVVSDMATENQKLYKDMGVSEEQPFFQHPVTACKIACFHDPPHLLKLARNHLFDDGFVLNPKQRQADQQIACMEPLDQLVKLAPGHDIPVHNITRLHLAVQGTERQIVKLASQVLSNKSALAVHDAGKKQIIKSKHCEVCVLELIEN